MPVSLFTAHSRESEEVGARAPDNFAIPPVGGFCQRHTKLPRARFPGTTVFHLSKPYLPFLPTLTQIRNWENTFVGSLLSSVIPLPRFIDSRIVGCIIAVPPRLELAPYVAKDLGDPMGVPDFRCPRASSLKPLTVILGSLDSDDMEASQIVGCVCVYIPSLLTACIGLTG